VGCTPVERGASAFSATRKPQELTKRLDSLVNHFAHRIDDPVRRQEFVNDIGHLKHINADGLSTQELYERVVGSLRERLSTEEGEREHENGWSISSVNSNPLLRRTWITCLTAFAALRGFSRPCSPQRHEGTSLFVSLCLSGRSTALTGRGGCRAESGAISSCSGSAWRRNPR
jgi:hypothetical protein